MTIGKTTTGFPVFCSAWKDDNTFIIAGGGGIGNSGVKNLIQLYTIEEGEVKKQDEIVLSRKEDAPTSLSLNLSESLIGCGINASEEIILSGKNKSLRTFKIDGKKIKEHKTFAVFKSKEPSDYQKVTAFNKKGTKVLCISAEGEVAVLNCPKFEKGFENYQCEKEQMQSGEFSPDDKYFITISDKRIHIFSSSTGKLEYTIENPISNKNLVCQFRNAKFGVKESRDYFYVAVNAKNKKMSWVCKFSLKNFELIQSCPTSFKPISDMCISHDGSYVSVSDSGMEIKLVSTKDLCVLHSIKTDHSFPITTLKVNNNSTYVLSGSADGTFTISPLPQKFGMNMFTVLRILISMFLILFAVYLQLLK